MRPLSYAVERLRYAQPREFPKLFVKLLFVGPKSALWSRTELRVYSYSAERIRALPRPCVLRRDCWEDLTCYHRSAFHDQVAREEFLQMAEERRRSGQHFYTLTEDGVLLHYGWLREREAEARDAKVKMMFFPPKDSAMLWDFFTHPKARGRGLYRQALCQALHDAVELANASRVYIFVLAQNAASRHVIEKLGFQHEGSLVREQRLWIVKRYAAPNASPFQVRPL